MSIYYAVQFSNFVSTSGICTAWSEYVIAVVSHILELKFTDQHAPLKKAWQFF